MKNIKKIGSIFSASCMLLVLALTFTTKSAEAGCEKQDYEDIYCSSTGCGDVGFDSCVIVR